MGYPPTYQATYAGTVTSGDYPDVYPWIRQCLRSVGSELADADFDRTVKSVLREILSPANVAYASLSGDDKDAVDEAAGYRSAMRLWPGLVTDGLGSSLNSWKEADVSESYGDAEDLLKQWAMQATVALASVTFLRRGPYGPLFGVNGPSRARRRECEALNGDDAPYRYGYR